MTDPRSPHESSAHEANRPSARIDSEIDVRRSVEIGLWLAGTTVGTLVVGYFIYLGLARWTAGEDPKASPIAQANQIVLPPAPNLQIHPEQELAAMRADERQRLTTWGWVDKSRGLVHIPIDEAIARLAVPAAASVPASETAATAAVEAAPVAAPPAHEGAAH
ncbi:MAG: hypothetical protein ABI639_09880 [Thermoanaerobaculia bacterium]